MMDFAGIRELARQERRLRWAIEKQMARATRVTSAWDGMPRSGGTGDRMEEDVIRMNILKEQHAKLQAQLAAERGELQGYIAELPDATERVVMSMRYLQNMRIEAIGQAVNYCDRQVFRILRRAEDRIRQRQA